MYAHKLANSNRHRNQCFTKQCMCLWFALLFSVWVFPSTLATSQQNTSSDNELPVDFECYPEVT